MTVHTENLAILFTDIAGFTEATSRQSRRENEKILSKHNEILIPIVRNFGGKHVKSIGDALLLTFRSPTDAMLCAMAMQDALHEHNLSVSHKEEIHIRIAASLGEVRVTKNDVFGEPVNVTSRIEGITPPDEIYFSEAVYLAMNKAEVPTLEVGREQLKGISKDIRIYCIPRFASPMLVDQNEAAELNEATITLPELHYPFGGAHLSGSDRRTSASTWRASPDQIIAACKPRKVLISSLLLIIFYLIFTGTAELPGSPSPESIGNIRARMNPELLEPSTNDTTRANEKSDTRTPILETIRRNQESPKKLVMQASKATAPIPSLPPRALKVNDIPKTVQKKTTPTHSRFSTLKKMYRDGHLSKPTYSARVRSLKEQRDMRIRQLKAAYRDGKISKTSYKQRYRALVLSYE